MKPSPLIIKPVDHLLGGMPIKHMQEEELALKISQFAHIAKEGIQAQTQGLTKVAESALHKSLDSFRAYSEIGIYHKEQISVLSVDIRDSSTLAIEKTPEAVFFAMQCYLPLMAYIVAESGGEIISLRGDGLIAGFGFETENWIHCVNDAYECGMLMIQSTSRILNPMLAHQDIPIKLSIGVGIDCGRVIVTKIGFGLANEVTAYGEAVNTAAKNSKGMNNLWLSARTCKVCSSGGDVRTSPMTWTPGWERLW